jgi:nitrogen fixation protein NifU and related proteins
MPGQEALFDDLYREIILDYSRNPRNKGTLAGATNHAEGLNPVCGDEVRIDVALDNGRIGQYAFDGQGCSISQASASILGEVVSGKAIDEALAIAKKFESMLTSGAEVDPALGDLEAFQGVAKFHARIKCATLASKVLADALASPTTATPGGEQ